LQKVEKGYQQKIDELTNKVELGQGQLRHALLHAEFSQDPNFNGPSPHTRILPDFAEAKYSEHFTVMEVEGRPQVVAFDPVKKEPIESKTHLGQPRGYKEHIQVLLDQHPRKNEIVESSPGGGGGQGNSDYNFSGKDIYLSEHDARNPTAYQAAKKQATERGGNVIVKR
jgi:hypothetical protein